MPNSVELTQELAHHPLVLLTGTGCDERVFAPLVTELQKINSNQVIMIEVVGEADSAQAESELLLQRLPEKFVLAGFSLGGIVALALYFTDPSRVAGLIMIDSNARADSPENADKRLAQIKRIKSKGLKHLIIDDWPKQVAQSNANNADLKDYLIAMAKNTGLKRLAKQTNIALTRVNSLPLLSKITVPTLIIFGEEDLICHELIQQEMAELIPESRFIKIPQAGHFLPVEQPKSLGDAIHIFLTEQQYKTSPLSQHTNSLKSQHSCTGADMKTYEHNPEVLQVERRDFTDLVPENRQRVQPLEGFDDIYTDIVDYIIRCTHRIWDERDIGLIYTHYTHNCVLYTALGTLYDREEVVRDTIQRLASFPERRGLATQVIWNGNDQEGFYTSHLVTGVGRHTQNGHFGPATGRTFVSRTIADCMIHKNKIYREWIATDTMALVKQLNLDPHAFAERIARNLFNKGLTSVDIGENGRMLGQYHPTSEAFTDIASNDIERHTLTWMHEAYNRRMLGILRQVYAPNVQYHGPMMRELYGVSAITHQMLGLIASLPDAVFMPQHIASTPCEEGGVKVAVRWNLEGHHLGYGLLTELGEPTGKRVQLLGITHFHYKDGKIVDEWNVYDELALLMQIKLGQLAAGEPLQSSSKAAQES